MDALCQVWLTWLDDFREVEIKMFTDSNEPKGDIFTLTIISNLHYTINSYLLVV